ncbi:MAG TPA: hypothetical protein VGC96_10665 [Candidatus Elarobacter sp.]
MKALLRALIAFVAVVALGAGAWFGWRFFGPKPALGYAQVFATAPAPCPDDPNDLAGIEGWAPGAGQAQKIGQTGAGNFGGFGGAVGGDSSTPAPDATKTCKGISPELDRYFARIVATGDAIPSTDYDATARAATLETPDAIFAFVRDRIATEAYPGAMRGANGTLAAHGGSPADKALLLAALLGAKQIPVRFVHGPLSDAETETVLKAVDAAPPKASAGDPEILKKLGLDPAQVAATSREQRERVKQLADEGIARARTATDALLSAAGVHLASADSTAQQASRAALRDHWWLQAQQNGAWSDLDPTLPSAKAGTHLASAAGDPADALPDDASATVTLALVGTFIDNGAASEKTLVTASAKTADLALSSFSVVIGDRSKGAQNLTEARSFTPSITLAGSEQSGDAFEADGSPRLATLRLRIVTQLPGTSARTAERVIVDRRQRGGTVIDPAWTPERTALALTSTSMGLVVPGELSRDFTAKQDAQSAKLGRAFSAYVTAGGNGRQIPPPGVGEAYPYEVMHYFLYDSIARMRLEDASTGAVRFSFDRPQIAMVRRGFTQHGKQRAGILEFDVVDNAMKATGPNDGAVRANAVRGYMDTNIERHVLGVEPVRNTIALFDAASHGGVKPKAVTQADRGSVRIVPDGQVSLGGRVVGGWWDVDPQTGNLLGRMEGGAGQALVEYAIDRVNDWATLVTIMQFYGDFFRCIATGVEAPLSGSANPQADFNNCALGALCNLAEATVVGEGFSRCDVCTQIDALIYNFLDYGTYGKSSSPGSFGYVCGKLFPSPF